MLAGTPQKGTVQEYLFDLLTLARHGKFTARLAKKQKAWYKKNEHLQRKNAYPLTGAGAVILQKKWKGIETTKKQRTQQGFPLYPEQYEEELNNTYYYHVQSIVEDSVRYPELLMRSMAENLDSVNEAANYVKKYANWKPKKGTSAETLFNLLADLETQGADDFDFDNVQGVVDELSANSKNPKALTEIGDNIERAVNTLEDYEMVEDNEDYDEDSEEYEEWEDANDDWQDAKFYTIQLIAKLKE